MAYAMTSDLRTKILAASAVSALIGTRVYPDLIPQDVTYPCANVVLVGGTEEATLASGTCGLADSRVQINAWAVTRLGALELADAIREAIIGYKGTTGTTVFGCIKLEGTFRSFYEDDVKVWQVQQDFIVTHEVNRP
jgi:hypothetical protein